jgi:uncharacterized damage-inducible protein DinB
MMDDALQQLLESWRTNERINLRLIEEISEEGMRSTLSTRGGRDVARQFAHLHNVRVWHLEKRARQLAEGLSTFETADSPDKARLVEALAASSRQLERYIEACVAEPGRYRCFKKGIAVYVAYFVAHESHHRGNILLTLKQSGHGLDKKVRYAIWDWDRL